MKIAFNAAVIVDDILYYSDYRINALMMIDLMSNSVHYLGEFPNEAGEKNIHKACIKNNNYLYFIPSCGQNIHIYDLANEELTYKKITKNNPGEACFAGGFIKDDELWVLPWNINQDIIIWNFNTDIISTTSFLKNQMKDRSIKPVQFFWKYIICNDCIYFGVLGTSMIARWNLNDNSFLIIETDIMKIEGIYCLNNTIYVATSNAKVYIWDQEKNISEELHLSNVENESYVVANIDSNIILIPVYGNKILMKKPNKDNFYYVNSEKELKISGVNNRVNFEGYISWHDQIVLMNNYGFEFLYILTKEGLKSVDVSFETDRDKKLYEEKLKRVGKETIYNQIVNEEVDYSFDEFIKFLEVIDG